MATTLHMRAGGNRRAARAGTSPKRCRRKAFSLGAGIACAILTTTAFALDLNSFRAQHGLRPLSASGALAGAAYSHAHNLAARQRLDHAGFRQRVSVANGTAAENVAFGCPTEDCVIRM